MAFVWIALTWVNPLIEVAYLTSEIRDDRITVRTSTDIFNPSIRFAISHQSGLQIVPLFSTPVLRGRHLSKLCYLSF